MRCFSAAFVLLFLLLNQPEVILISHFGSVAWYPATGLAMALILGISPWYAILLDVASVLAGKLIYHQSVVTVGQSLGSVGFSACYGVAAYLLRGPLRIDLGLARRRDVMRYVFVTMTAAMVATVIGVSSLLADRLIPWSEVRSSSWGWFVGDGIGLLGVAPFS